MLIRIFLHLTLSVVSCLSFHHSFAQTLSNIRGTLVDSTGVFHLGNTSVSALRASDSVLVNFTRADENGFFELKVPSQQEYILLLVHPDMATLVLEEKLTDANLDLGSLYLSSKTFILEEFVVIGQRAITIKGDTTEYSADSFRVREFDNVDDLLKRLPGLEVDQSGNITAHGEKVQRMLVDGDEFFSDDPAVLAKMMRASAVNKVQVYDAKSEDAQFTGVDDGVRVKTINLKLKDNAKKGYFGKIEAGGGLPEYWENTAALNYFRDKQKISFFGMASNTNRVGMNWTESRNFSDGGRYIQTDGVVVVEVDGDEFDGYGGGFAGQGLPKTINAGVAYADRFGKEKENEIAANYRINDNSVVSTVSTRNHYTLPDTQYVNVSNSNNRRTGLLHTANARTRIVIDSTADFTISARGKLTKSQNFQESNAYNADINEVKANESHTRRTTHSDNQDAGIDATFRKRFKKEGRTIITTGNASYGATESDGDFLSANTFFGTGEELNYNQIKKNATNNLTAKIKVSYTEPLSEHLHLTISGNALHQDAAAERLTYDRIGAVDSLNHLFSSHYEFQVNTFGSGLNLGYKYNKWSLSVGGEMARTSQLHRDLFLDSNRNYSFYNFFPRLSISSNENGKYVNIAYNGSTRQPTIDQLQPLLQNTDPLYVRLGNPNLQQEFRHMLNFQVSQFNLLTQNYYYIGGYANYTTNAISTSQILDANGVSTYQPINVDFGAAGNLYAGYHLRIPQSDFRLNISITGGGQINQSALNLITTQTTSYFVNPNLGLSYNQDTTSSFSLSLAPAYNTNFTNTADIRNDYWSHTTRFDGNYNFPYGWSLSSDINWRIREKITPQDNQTNVFLWNATLSKSFLKDRSLIVSLEAYDILNQNIGFSRTVFNNVATETEYNRIQQYFMLKLSWNFTKSGALSESKNEVEEEFGF